MSKTSRSTDKDLGKNAIRSVQVVPWTDVCLQHVGLPQEEAAVKLAWQQPAAQLGLHLTVAGAHSGMECTLHPQAQCWQPGDSCAHLLVLPASTSQLDCASRARPKDIYAKLPVRVALQLQPSALAPLSAFLEERLASPSLHPALLA